MSRLLAFKEGIKTRKIKQKCEGDRFMADCHCDNGFSHSFHFIKMLPPEKDMRLKLSNLKSRELGLLDTSTDSNHKFWVDNLKTSMNFVVKLLK